VPSVGPPTLWSGFRATLKVDQKVGAGHAVYQYDNCYSDVWEELIDPDISVGRFISDELDRHPYRRIR
jgi:hypothetical protein